MINTILQTIGNTPLVKLPGIADNPEVAVYAKLEGQNPGGSIKDRVAMYMIERAEQQGELTKDKTILEATSGNMGIALAMVGAAKGYQVQIVMSAGMSEERKKMMRALGADLTLTDPAQGTQGAIEHVHKLLKQNPDKYWFANQFNNENNVLAHAEWTAPEILKQQPSIDYIVAGTGTSGTIMGLAKYFKQASPHTKMIGVAPPPGYGIQGLQNPQLDFIGDIYNRKQIDEILTVPDQDAYATARHAARKYGLFCGMSSGAALYAAQQKTRGLASGTIVVIIPDRGEKYLSTPLFE